MKIDRLYTRKALATTPATPLAEAAAAMHRFQVGTLLVMEDEALGSRPVGIVTDRDLAIHGLTIGCATVGAAMTPVVAMVREDADTHEALEVMRAHGVRRLVVTDEHGGIRGILSVDDIVDGLSTDLAAAAAVLRGEIRTDAAGLGEIATAATAGH